LKFPPNGRTRYFHTKTITPPVSIPASAPCILVRRQKRANSTSGPKDAPKPAHAKDTMVNTELSGFHARKTATMAIPITVRRAAFMEAAVLILIFKKSWSRFWDTPEAAVKSWESAVDMVHARIPASTTPATSDSKKPFCPRRCANWMITVSDWELVVNIGIEPATEAPYPMIPIRMATHMEISTHTVAIRRESTSFFSSSIAMKRRRI